MKTIMKLTIGGVMALATTAHAGPSWGFTLGNGAGFYYGNSSPRNTQRHYYNCAPQYQTQIIPMYRPSRVCYGPPVVVRERFYNNQNVILMHSWR